jgi:hypothetical protein
MIFFTDPQTGQARSLETLKYIYKGPKKAISAFLFFSKEIRDTIGKDLSNDEFAKRSGEAWKNLPDEQKRVISQSLILTLHLNDIIYIYEERKNKIIHSVVC